MLQTPKEFYEAEYIALTSAREREGNKRDNVIFLIASGTLALSVPQILSLANGGTLVHPILLLVGWISLALSGCLQRKRGHPRQYQRGLPVE